MKSFLSCLKNIGIKNNDTVFFYIDAALISQIASPKNINKNEFFINEIIKFFYPNGTIVMPTFTYSFTKNENYDLKKTPSLTGLITELFRKNKEVSRSSHPIFSVAVNGKKTKEFLNCTSSDCFGEKTTFDLMKKLNAKIVCLGCSLDRVTFVHYIEQQFNVKYRFFKNFSGHIIDKKKYYCDTRFFVRNTEIDMKLSLDYFEHIAEQRGSLKKKIFGRFYIRSISSNDFFNLGMEMLSNNEYSLIK